VVAVCVRDHNLRGDKIRVYTGYLEPFLIAIDDLDIDDKRCGIAAGELRLLACWLGSMFHDTRRHTTLTLINTGKV